MEKKTIGAFISALRRASGMTQRELGERLFVSDKTVSRWERDECTPDLSLIPIIADLFGVSSDELLRGERSTPSINSTGASCPPHSPTSGPKGDRRFRLLLQRRKTKYTNLSIISIGITLLSLILVAVINLAFLRAYVAFGVGAALFLAAMICQTCFCTHFRVRSDTDEEAEDGTLTPSHADAVSAFNNYCVLHTKNILALTLCLLAFCLPLATLINSTHAGLSFSSWISWGCVFSFIALVIIHCLWVFWLRGRLVKQELLLFSTHQWQGRLTERSRLSTSLAIMLSVLAVSVLLSIMVQSLETATFAKNHVFETKQDFIDFAQTEPSASGTISYEGLFTFVEQSTPVPVNPPSYDVIQEEDPDDTLPVPSHLIREFYDKNGNVAFSYVCRQNISLIRTSDSPDGFPIQVYTVDQMRMASHLQETIQTMIWLTFGIFTAILSLLYIKRLIAARKTYR